MVQLNGSGSFDPNGTITSYSWDFGDGTSSTGAVVNHQYDANGVYSISLSVTDNDGNAASSQGFVAVNSVALPVKINFDELPNNTVVTDQYLNQYGVRFYSDNLLYPVHTWQRCGNYCATTSLPNYVWTGPNITGQTIVEFTQPVSNLSFFIIGIDVFFDPFAVVDVYRNNALYGSFIVYGNGTATRQISFGSLDNISKVVIRSIRDPYGIGFDDFTFNVPSDIKITSGRVGGYLNGTTQHALLGGDIALQATPLPGGFAGGTYSWTCSPSALCQIVAGSNTSSVNLRTLDTGIATATVSYTKNGLTATGSVTINSVLPTLTSFTGQQADDRVNPPGQCGAHGGGASLLWWYDLGCKPSVLGISFLAAARPPSTFLSDPSRSGLKFVQAISTFRKSYQMGLRCDTRRTSESDVASGWQLDTSDPFKTELGAVRYFSEMLPFTSDLSVATDDFPGSALTRFLDYEFVDSMYIDDRFEMYAVYFSGNDPAHPIVQRPIGRLRWNWGGLVVFEWDGSAGIHRRRNSNGVVGTISGESQFSMVAMNGNVDNNDINAPCPGGPPRIDNKLESSRFFVRQHYLDFLGREPDASGWGFWTSQISECAFDPNCIRARRINLGLAFMFCDEFTQTDPVMAARPGTPGFDPSVYNRRFVWWCYMKYLRRDPAQTNDIAGWDFWTNELNRDGNYAHIIDAFQVCPEYRNRTGFNLP